MKADSEVNKKFLAKVFGESAVINPAGLKIVNWVTENTYFEYVFPHQVVNCRFVITVVNITDVELWSWLSQG